MVNWEKKKKLLKNKNNTCYLDLTLSEGIFVTYTIRYLIKGYLIKDVTIVDFRQKSTSSIKNLIIGVENSYSANDKQENLSYTYLPELTYLNICRNFSWRYYRRYSRHFKHFL